MSLFPGLKVTKLYEGGAGYARDPMLYRVTFGVVNHQETRAVRVQANRSIVGQAMPIVDPNLTPITNPITMQSHAGEVQYRTCFEPKTLYE